MRAARSYMSDPDKERLLNEAADIFLQLQDAPDDIDAQQAKEDFLARGEAERKAYEKIRRTWQVSGKLKRPTNINAILILVLVCFGLYFAVPEVRIYLVADFQTGNQSRQIELSSRDIAYLDAGSALVDDTRAGARNVELLKGAAFFDVKAEDRPFVVTVGGVRVTVLGTAFEAAMLGDDVAVAVVKGSVRVDVDGRQQQLEPGDRLIWSPARGLTADTTEPADTASWRTGRLFADGMTFRQVAEVIERRLTGRVVIANQDLAQSRVTGSFDLTKPETALRALAATRGARVVGAQPLATMILAP